MSRHEVVSPIPGVFYRRPDPDSDPFASEGQSVGADDTLCLVEVPPDQVTAASRPRAS